MSRSVNRVALMGHVGKEPEVRSTANGARVANFTLATSRQWNSASGEKQERTEWHNIQAWNSERGPKHADVVERFLHKGDRVYIEGRIEYRQWQDKDGGRRYSTDILVMEIVLLGGKREPSDTPYRASATTPEALEAAVVSENDLPF